MVRDISAVLAHAQTIVIGNKDPDFKAVPDRLHEGQFLVDFVRIIEGRSKSEKYDGICW
jgi:GDP-mannose 6-dehydrogenase